MTRADDQECEMSHRWKENVVQEEKRKVYVEKGKRNRSLERKGTTKEEILWVLAICFAEEDKGKVEIVATTKVKEVEDF